MSEDSQVRGQALPLLVFPELFPVVWLPQMRPEESQGIEMKEEWHQPWAMGQTGYLHDYSVGSWALREGLRPWHVPRDGLVSKDWALKEEHSYFLFCYCFETGSLCSPGTHYAG